ncbi:hypothetical protein I5F12_02555 [Proteus cibarius]|uniref:Uncharacterized protein n=3 Tax=Proteus terrae TaxID=1574161 RepID=A0A6G6SVS3_9GAMM|nr:MULTISPECIES: hypothetical protein [Proteus]PNL50223.1 hypothetical protein CEP63_013845 [Proteus mirabilis]QHP76976.1 hypothetical protein EKQ45_13865 [Proteus vulgaris]MBG2913274.1 hypothetical protein [Proteus terrae subsp. cibarius]MBG3089850.1 hypothetical protein [Proteus terrae subsp. cibarius]MBG6036950.1 hypothetical protein [Proteus terrae subsp. cibarius]
MTKLIVTDSDTENKFYPTNISFNADGNTYLLSMSKDKEYMTRTVHPSGKLIRDPLADSGTFAYYYDYMSIAYDAVTGKQYLCCISTENKYFELFLIQDSGKLTSTNTFSFVKGFNRSIAIFIINSKFFVYIQNETTKYWEVMSISK